MYKVFGASEVIMKISGLFKRGRPVFSLEVFPPKKDGSINSIYSTLDGLRDLSPDYISVTYGAGGNLADTKTRQIASLIKNQYGIEAMAHLTCVSCSEAEVENILVDFKKYGIENILALRGDVNPNVPPKDDFRYASELTSFIKARGGFDVAGACYPECHTEAPDIDTDIENLKKKVDAGADFLVTQLFFDNSYFYSFREKAVRAGINIPMTAGIMPVTNKNQIERMVTMCGASIPRALSHIMAKYSDDPKALLDAGVEYAAIQIDGLLRSSVDGIHLYTMNNPEVAKRIFAAVKKTSL